jgi:hypothetical protein
MKKREILLAPVFGEVSPRLAHNVMVDQNLKRGLRKARNVFITRNLEMALRPPTRDIAATPGGTVSRTFPFRFASGNYCLITFSNLDITQTIVGTGASFSPFVSTWTAADVEVMDAHQYKNDLVCVTAAKEPRILRYDGGVTWTWVTLESAKVGATVPPWHTAADWPISISFLIGRFIFVSKRKYYGSGATSKSGGWLDFALTMTTKDGDTVVTPSSAFSYDAADDKDSGFKWVRGGTMAMAGSPKGVWSLSNVEDPISATNPNIKNYSSAGCSSIPGADINKGFAYMSADNKTVRFFAVTQDQGMLNPELNKYAKHLFEESPLKRMVFQANPDPILWCLREDGKLVSFVGDETRQTWTRFETDGLIKDIWVAQDNTSEYLYMDVDRYTDRRIERIDEYDAVETDYFTDGKVTYTIGPIKQIESVADGGSGEGVFTIIAHGYSDGDVIRMIELEGYSYGYIADKTPNTFKIELENLNLVPFSVGSDFTVQEAVREITNAWWANKTIDVFRDGYYESIVANGSGLLQFTAPGSVIEAGIPYDCEVEPQSFVDVQGPDKAAVSIIHPRFHKSKATLYGKTGLDYEINLIPPDDTSYSGIKEDLTIGGGMSHDATFYIGGHRTTWILLSCIIDIEVAED